MKLHFPYKVKPSPEFYHIYNIEVRLQIRGKKTTDIFDFTFDTGAEVTSIPVSAAIKLGINLKKCPRIKMSGFEGTIVTVYRSNINVVFNKKVLTIPCVFHPNEEVPLLLGGVGILDKFTITLDARKRVATFEEI